MSFPDHFSAVAERYARYRPRYPRALVDALADRCAAHDVAWDAGCGSGQLSVGLAARFERVIATDPAQSQLDQAQAHPQVEYRRAPAEDSGLPAGRPEAERDGLRPAGRPEAERDGLRPARGPEAERDGLRPARGVDLAVAAQAAHWFDWPRYVAEVGRVARPGALAAVLCYSWLEADGAVQPLIARYYEDLGPYWAPNRRHVETGYRELAWPWPEVEAPALELVAEWTREELCGYVATWSATQALVRRAGSARFDELCADLARLWPDGERRSVRWPLALRLARVSGPSAGAAL